MSHRPATVLDPSKIALLRKALQVAPMQWPFTGLSMWPAIRPGDECRIQAVPPETLAPGDIILTTRDDRLYAHRVIDVAPGPPRQWIIKGDTLLFPDPPVQEGGLLGLVIGIQRGTRYHDLAAPAARRKGRWMAGMSGPYSRAFLTGLNIRRRAISRLAAFAVVRRERRARAGEVSARPAGEEDIPGVAVLMAEQEAHRPSGGGGIDMDVMHDRARAMLEGARANGATLWVADLDGFIAACAVIGPLGGEAAAPGWWVMSVYVKMTARGRGLAEAIVRAGLRDASDGGEPVLRYAAYSGNRASVALAAKCGFVPDAGPEAAAFSAPFGEGLRGNRLLVLAARTGIAVSRDS